MLQKSGAVVLSTINYNESSFIATLFTREQGALPFMVRRPKTSRSSMRTNIFQPLQLLHIEWNHHEARNFQSLRTATPACYYRTLHTHPIKTAISLFLAEALFHALRNEQTNPDLYDYIDHSIRFLDLCDTSVANFHIIFLLRMAPFLGLRPNLTPVEGAICFDMLGSCYAACLPDHPYYINGRELELLPTLIRLRFSTMHLLPLTRLERNRITDLILQYYRLHVPAFGRLHSPDILKQILDD